MVRQESADARLLERNLVAVADLLAWTAVCHEFLDFFGCAARCLVAHRIVRKNDFLAEAGNAALLAVAPLAVRHWRRRRVESFLPFAAQVLLGRACVDKIPREYFVLFAFAIDPACIVSAFVPDFKPFVEVKTVAVAFENDSLLVSGVDDWPETAVATAIDCLEETRFPCGPIDFYVRVLVEFFANKSDVSERCFFVHKRRPLEPRKRFRNKNPDAHRDLNAAVVLAPNLHEIENQVAECLHVV